MQPHEFTKTLVVGGLTDAIDVGGVPAKVITTPPEGVAGRPLIIAFHGSVSRTLRTIPVFEGSFLLRELDGATTIVALADPALALAGDFVAGWYARTHKFDTPAAIQKICRAIVDEVKPSRLIFVGTSTGAHAALYHSAQCPGSICIAQNPITCISRFLPESVVRMRNVCWPSLPETALLSSVVQDDVGPLYDGGHKNTVVILQNADDQFFLDQAATFLAHIQPGCEFMLCSEYFPNSPGHTYPHQRLARWVRAAIEAPTTNVRAIATRAASFNTSDRAPTRTWHESDIELASQIASSATLR